jgi:hypothetical protein
MKNQLQVDAARAHRHPESEEEVEIRRQIFLKMAETSQELKRVQNERQTECGERHARE